VCVCVCVCVCVNSCGVLGKYFEETPSSKSLNLIHMAESEARTSENIVSSRLM
jgi:hypothetical protein